jgi:hypothetical protein
LCRRWNWRNKAGRLKDMACRTLLLKLEGKELIRLPERQRPSSNDFRNRQQIEMPHDQSLMTGALSARLAALPLLSLLGGDAGLHDALPQNENR